MLSAAVVPSKTKCIVREDAVILELVKMIPEMWHTLQQPLPKQQLVEAKKSAIDRQQQNTAALLAEKESKYSIGVNNDTDKSSERVVVFNIEVYTYIENLLKIIWNFLKAFCTCWKYIENIIKSWLENLLWV